MVIREGRQLPSLFLLPLPGFPVISINLESVNLPKRMSVVFLIGVYFGIQVLELQGGYR
jgi:hypothetical protein